METDAIFGFLSAQDVGATLRWDALEGLSINFGRTSLIFCLKNCKIMKNDTTSMRMRSGDHFGDAKMSKKGTLLRRIYLFYESQ